MKRFAPIRVIVQLLFFAFVFFLTTARVLKEWGIAFPFPEVADFHALCPFGAVETIGRLLTQGEFIPKTYQSNFWIFIATAGITLLFGSVFCSWLCPLGSIQDWIGKVGQKIFKKHYNRFYSHKADKFLGYLRYIVLILIIVQTTRLLSLVFVKVDPYYALFHFWTGNALPSAIIVLVVVLVASLFIERPWCRWFCPFGALLGILQIISPWKIRRNTDQCISCGLCSKACPMNIDVDKKIKILDTRCNRCGECLASCPVEDTLDHSLAGTKKSPKHRLSINNRLLSAAIIIVLFISPVVIAKQAGLFITSSKSEVIQGQLKAEEIKTSMTLDELATGFNTTLPALLDYLELPSDLPGDTKLRDIEDVIETVTTGVIRDRMVLYSN